MGCVAVMLHIHTPPVEPLIIMYMPIPKQVLKPEPPRNDLGHDTRFYKSDSSHFRSPWLDHSVPSGGRIYNRFIIKTIVCTLAIYGLYSLFF